MDKKNEIEDSLEFCREIQYYKNHVKTSKEEFQRANIALSEFARWLNSEDKQFATDYTKYESLLEEAVEKNECNELQKQTTEVQEEREDDVSSPSLLRDIYQIVICVAIAVFLTAVVTTYFVSYTRINGKSMEIALDDGDIVMLNRIGYHLHDPKQFDVIVFSGNQGVRLVKRIIAVPGQTVQIVDGKIYIDGEVLEESYGSTETSTAGIAANPITLKEDEYFVLGDNRKYSTDSRSEYVGLVKKEDIIGEVVYRIYPFDAIGKIE